MVCMGITVAHEKQEGCTGQLPTATAPSDSKRSKPLDGTPVMK